MFFRFLTKELNYKTKIYDVKFNNYNKSAIYNQIGSHGFLPLLKSGNVDYLYPKCLENMKWYKLVNIMIYNSQGGFIKTFNFEYDDKPTERLMLLGISESKPNSLQEKKHRFYYNEPNSLPDYLSNKTDHWGFFNNTYAAYSQSSGDNYYNLRNPNAAYLKYGILNKIVYPTGGYTEFDFEPHYYKKQVMLTRDSYRDLNSNNLAGGLRIRGMADYTSENVKVEEKKYFYVSDYLQHKDQANQSSGVLGGQIQYSFDYIVHAFNDGYNTKTKLSVFSSVSVLPACYNTQGNHIGYSEVIEKRRDNAFTRYLYTNFDNGYLDEPAQTIIQETRTPYEPYSSKEQDRGLLQLKEEYNADGKKIRSTANSYEISNNDPSYVRSMRAKFANVCPNTAQSYDEGAAYKIYTYERRPKSVKTILYDLDGLHPISTNVNYEYTANSDGLLRSEEHNRDGGLHTNSKIEYRYAADVGHTTMVQQNMIGIPIETITYRDGRAMNVMLQPYRNENGKLFPDFQQRLEVDTPIDNYIKYTVTAGMDSRLQRQLTFDVYDSHGNILQYTRRDGVPVSYIWSYKGQYPIAEIKGATYEQVKTLLGVIYVTDFDNSLYPDVVELGSRLRTAFQDQPVFVHTFTHKPSVGIASQTDPNGITTFYEYDDLGRLHIVRDHEGNVLKEKEYHYFNE